MAAIGMWAMILFFLWYGLRRFVTALNTDMFQKVGAVLALVYGVIALLGQFGIGM